MSDVKISAQIATFLRRSWHVNAGFVSALHVWMHGTKLKENVGKF